MNAAKRPDRVEAQLTKLSRLRKEPPGAITTETLVAGLQSRNNLIVARAATVAAELNQHDLEGELETAFQRFLVDPIKTDQRCLAKQALARAIVDMELPATEVLLLGAHHVQMEPSFGRPVDSAVDLRATCAIGLVNCGHPDVVMELLPRLLDAEAQVRVAAARAIGACGDPAAVAVLRLKVLTGDDEPDVLIEALAALFELAPRRTLDFVRSLLEGGACDPGAAILALGDSRLEAAFPLLQQQWQRANRSEERRIVLHAMVALRREPAIDFVFGIVADGAMPAAREGATALAALRLDPTLRQRMEQVVEGHPHGVELWQLFEE
ncbi:MAG: HEAT repeat domain-containing protein [Planctomycetota bacterium]